jgi:hypothetical protein
MHATTSVCLPVVAFPRRTSEEHRRLGDEYRRLSTPTARKAFVKEHATRYSELSRLPYFDLVEQIVIDPMHNLFLGIPCLYLGLYYALTRRRPGQDSFLWYLGAAEDPSSQSRTECVPHNTI